MRNELNLRTPSSWHGDMWREALPLGNGELGAQVFGGAWLETISISHSRLWWHAKSPELPDVSDTLPIMREKLAAHDFIDAERIMADALNERGYAVRSIGEPLPLCDICICTEEMGAFRHYRRTLDMEKGEARISFMDGERSFLRRTFVSREDDLCRTRITADKPFSITVELVLRDAETLGNVVPPQNVMLSAGDGTPQFSAENENGLFFGSVLRIETDGEKETAGHRVRVKNATYAELTLAVFIDGERETGLTSCRRALDAAESYEFSFPKHAAKHSALYNAMEFSIGGTRHELSNEELLLEAYDGDMPAEFTEKMWSIGRYLLISSSRPGGLPCHLLGIWAGSWRPIWAFNMFNVNLQMTYWQALSGNMAETCLAVFDYLDSMLNDFRENARKLYGCRGIFISAVSTPESGIHKNHNPHILHYTGAAGWIAQHYYDYYLTTRDEAFLKERALPFLYEVALFYEDFVTTDQNGHLHFSPSNSPENVPKNYLREERPEDEAESFGKPKELSKHGGCRSEVTENATMDFAICKEVLTNLLEGCAITGQYAKKWQVWREMLGKIPPYMINEDGAVREWMDPFYEDNYEHRHQSHVYPVFPGTEITEKNDPALYRAFVTAMDKRRVVGLKDQSGWSLTYMSNVFARMGNGDAAEECLSWLSRSNVMNNFVTVHNDWRRMGIAICNDYRNAPVQLDANMGFTAAVQEMALFSAKGEINLFHAIPRKWKNGKIGPLSTRTGTAVTLSFTESGGEAVLVQEKGVASFLLSAGHGWAFEDSMGERNIILKEGEKRIFRVVRKNAQ